MNPFGAFFSSATNKVFAIAIVTLMIACGLFYWQWHSYQDKYDTAKATIGVQARTIKERDDTITKMTQSQAITDKTRTEVKADQDKVTVTTKVIQHDTVVKVVEIEKKYKDLPPTPENKVKEDKEVSMAYLDSMWRTYCTSEVNDPGCQMVPADPPPSAQPQPTTSPVKTTLLDDTRDSTILLSVEESVEQNTFT